jgi:hypothetical protein
LANPFGSLDGTCNNQVFDLSRPYPAALSMLVPALNPGQRCIVRVSAQPKVRKAGCAFNLLGLLSMLSYPGMSPCVHYDEHCVAIMPVICMPPTRLIV